MSTVLSPRDWHGQQQSDTSTRAFVPVSATAFCSRFQGTILQSPKIPFVWSVATVIDKTSRPVVLSCHMPSAQVGCDEGRLSHFCVSLSSKSPSSLLLTCNFCLSDHHIRRSWLCLHDHIIGCTVTPLRPRTSRFSVINVCTKSGIKLPAYWKHSVSLLSDRQNITQAAPGFFLDWRGTSDKQHAGPTMGHQNDENTQQTSRKAASRCRHWRNCFAFGDTDNCGEALTFWWDASRPRGMHFSSKCLSKKKIIIFLSLSRGKGLQPQVWSFEINWMMHGVVIRLWISMKAQCDTAYTCSVLM